MKTRPALLRFAMLAAVLVSSAGPVASAGQPARVAAPQRQAAQRSAALDFEPATLVADLNPTDTSEGSGPTQYITLGSMVYFVANHPGSGSELWRTNGFAAGTRLVADICPGAEGDVEEPTVFAGQLYFSADDCSNGRELWTSDGTVTNTVMVRDIYSGASVGSDDVDPLSSNPEQFTEYNGELFFAANDGVNGDELWKTDGTHDGTVMVKDIAPGSSSSNISEMLVFSGTLFFVADGGTSNFGEELWKTDGTEAGTERVTDISLNSGDADVANLTAVDALGVLFFSADDDSTNGTELWKTDGTTAGTAMVKNIATGALEAFPSYLCEYGSLLLFRASDGTDTELWRSDGTELGTVEIEIYTGGSSNPVGLATYGSEVLLAARHQDSAFMPWLWSTDGITVTKVAELNAGGGGDPEFTEVAGIMYFRAYDVDSNVEIWKTDGSEANTTMLKDVNPLVYSNPHSLFAAPGNHLLFSADDGTTGSEPWVSDGTELGTELLADIHPAPGNSYPSQLTAHGGSLVFLGNDASFGYGLWQSPDLSSASLITDIVSTVGAAPIMLGNGVHLLFQGNDGITGGELWRTDGSPAGTTLVKDIHTSGDSYPEQFTLLGDTAFFVASDADGGQELWSSQGTEGTTVRVADIYFGTNSSSPDELTVFGGQLYFFANDGVAGQQLWRTDGTTTTQISDISIDSEATMAASGDTLYFSASEEGDGDFSAAVASFGENYELWQYDGASVTLAAEIDASDSADPYQLTDVAGTLYFVADDGTHGHELWQVSGGSASLVADTLPGSGSGGPNNLTAVGGTLYFTANDGTHGIELWQAEAGTASLVEDIYPGTTGSLPTALVNVLGKVLFAAGDPTGGYELWQSDGTPEGTERVEDIVMGPRSSNPSELTVVHDRLYFSAFDNAHGYELWGLDLGLEFSYLPTIVR